MRVVHSHLICPRCRSSAVKVRFELLEDGGTRDVVHATCQECRLRFSAEKTRERIRRRRQQPLLKPGPGISAACDAVNPGIVGIGFVGLAGFVAIIWVYLDLISQKDGREGAFELPFLQFAGGIAGLSLAALAVCISIGFAVLSLLKSFSK
jgi:hypothetical protein